MTNFTKKKKMINSNPRKFEEKLTNFVSWYWPKKKKKKSSYAFWKQTYLLHFFNKLLLIYIYMHLIIP